MADPNSDIDALRQQWLQTHDPATGAPVTKPASSQTRTQQSQQSPASSPATIPAAGGGAASAAPRVTDPYASSNDSAFDLFVRQPATGFAQTYIDPIWGMSQSALHASGERNRILPWSGEDIGNPVPPVTSESYSTPAGTERLLGARPVYDPANPLDPSISPLQTFNRGAMRAAGAAAPFAIGTGLAFTPAAGLGVEGVSALTGGVSALAERYANPWVADAVTGLGTLIGGPEVAAGRIGGAGSMLTRFAETAGRVMHPLVGGSVDLARWSFNRMATLATNPRQWIRAGGPIAGGVAGPGQGPGIADPNALSPYGANPGGLQ